MYNYKQWAPVVLRILLYIILIELYVINPLEKNLTGKEMLIFAYTLISVVSFWKINLFYSLWTVASVVFIAYYFIV